MSRLVEDAHAWRYHWMLLPATPRPCSDPVESMAVVGNGVKSIALEPGGGPVRTGRLAAHDEPSRYVVIGWGEDARASGYFVWTGTRSEYYKEWTAD